MPLRQDRHREGYVPDWISANAAMPLSGAPAGQQRFLSSLGLPQEEGLERIKTLNGGLDATGTMIGFASMLNPIIKAPLEQLSDRQFFSGRRLSDLHPTGTASAIGSLVGEENPQLLAQALANSPLARMVTTVDKLSDPRKSIGYKALNLGTGVRTTDVDIDKARTIEARNALEDMLKRQPHVRSFTNYFADPVALGRGELTAEEIMQLRMLNEMQRRGREYTKRMAQEKLNGNR
jgi:hypothetical protein